MHVLHGWYLHGWYLYMDGIPRWEFLLHFVYCSVDDEDGVVACDGDTVGDDVEGDDHRIHCSHYSHAVQYAATRTLCERLGASHV